MAESPEQNSVSITTETHSARTEITIEDSDGDEILSFTSAKSFSNLVFSSEDLENGKTYTVYFDGEAGETFTISSTTTFVGTANGMQIGGGMPMGMPPSGMRR